MTEQEEKIVLKQQVVYVNDPYKIYCNECLEIDPMTIKKIGHRGAHETEDGPPKKKKKVLGLRMLRLTPTIIKLCSNYMLTNVNAYGAKYDNVEGCQFNPYGFGAKDKDNTTVTGLIQQMICVIYPRELDYKTRQEYEKKQKKRRESESNRILCHHCYFEHNRLASQSDKVMQTTNGRFGVYICSECKSELLDIHNNMYGYISIIAQCGKTPGWYVECTKENHWGGEKSFWQHKS